jgi:predicted membrane protein
MKKLVLTMGVLVAVLSLTFAQEFKVAKSSGKLDIREVGEVEVEGYNGNEIIFTSRDHDRENDERAKGLRAVSSMGLEDNTGLGLSVVVKGDVIEVRQLKKMDGPDIIIKVPKGVIVSYSHTSPYGSDLTLKNMENEIEVSTVHNDVRLENVTGPMTINTVHGDIDASLSPAMKNPISIVSVHGHVDVAMPVATKATLRMNTAWGEIYVDPDFKIEFDNQGSMVKYSDNLSGKLNGGGIDMKLSSTHSNVYLRKK